jgi:hypothetical protein
MSIVEDQQGRDPTSNTHLCAAERLLTQVLLPGNCAEVLYAMAWKANLHPELYGYEKTLVVLKSILQAVSCESWDLTGSKTCDKALALAIDNTLGSLTATIDTLISDQDHKERIFSKVGTNPLYGYGSKQHGLNYILLDDLPRSAGTAAQTKWLALKAHLVRAQMRIMAHNSSPDRPLADNQFQKKLSHSLYDVCGRFARHFLRSEPEWLVALGLMPDFVCPSDYILGIRKLRLLVEERDPKDAGETAKRLLPIKQDLLVVLPSVDGFLEWGMDPDTHTPKNSPRTAGEADVDDEGNEGENEGRTAQRQHLPTHWRMEKSRRQKLLNLDDNPDEELLSTGPAQAEAEAVAAHLCGGSVEAANQLLPFSVDEPTAIELSRLLSHLDDTISTQTKREEVLFAAMISTIIWAGSSPKEAASLVAYCHAGAEPDADLAIRFSMDEQGRPCLPGVWRIRALQPKYFTVRELHEKARPRVSHFELPDFGGASRFLIKQLDAQAKTADHPSALVALSRGEAVSVFPDNAKMHRKMLRLQLRKIDSSGRLTAVRLSRIIFRRIVETSGGDIASAAIDTRNDHYLASVRRFYATPTVKYLRCLHAVALRYILDELATCGWTAPSLPTPLLSQTGEAVGSRLCATVPAMHNAFRWLRDTIERQLPLSDLVDLKNEFVIRHNAYTLYSVFAYCLSVGMRGIRTPYVYPRRIDPETRLVTITDKDNGTGYKRRLSIVLDPVYRQMQLYDRYLESLAVHGLPGGTTKMPCYFLKLRGTQFVPVIVRPTTIKLLSNEFFPFPPNFGRRLIRTELCERGIAPEYLDAWMGHWFRGEEPFGPYSTFSYSEYITCLQASDCMLSQLFKQFGFESFALEAR